MIPELFFLGALFFAVMLALALLSEDERLEDYSERRAVNRMADRSRRRKAPGVRPRCRYIRAGIQK